MEKLFIEINKRDVHYGNHVEQIRDMFARKQESLSKKDDKFFSKYWQVYAWTAIIGFINDKREFGADLPNKSSFQYQMISNGSESIAHALLLMAIGKVETSKADDFLNSRKLLTIISEYAEGGAKHILEIRQTPGYERKFDSPDDFLLEVVKR
ncbi:hypothetical protein ASF10_07060 [Flavobacterium sp. Leaf82]|uniref:hypothetical protein n=1 Tax=Flavobacterium sp. Leaf82 TaxID=1736238 RepID=UPI0006FFFA54|nr:hypothetical protein [Flavobacterium sp. Leaf82]KQO24927.1 hypothetical protein ASF10_07060 [Flavobacterium sp. Leaf82]